MLTLEAKKRTETGRKVNALRKQGFIPAVVYGYKAEVQSISIPIKAFKKALAEAGESTLLILNVEGKDFNVLIHDVSLDPVKDQPIHADFLAVQMDKEVHTKVELEFIGESIAVKQEGGVLVKVMHEIEVSALPKDLPHTIEVDLNELRAIGDRIFVSNLSAPNVKFLAPSDEVVALIDAPRTEEELKAELETEPAATVEVMTEAETKKKVEEEAKAAAGEPEEKK